MVKAIMHGCNGHMGQVISDLVEKERTKKRVSGREYMSSDIDDDDDEDMN